MDAKQELVMQPEKCGICGGSLENKTVTHRQPWLEELFEFEDVPALVCRQCDEVWLSAEVSQTIERVILKKPQPKRFHQVPVFSFNDLTGTTV